MLTNCTPLFQEHVRIKDTLGVEEDSNMTLEISKRWASLDPAAKDELNRRAGEMQAASNASYDLELEQEVKATYMPVLVAV